MLKSLGSLVTKHADGYYVTIGATEVKTLIPTEGLDIDDLVQFCPLGPDLQTSDLFSTPADNTALPNMDSEIASYYATADSESREEEVIEQKSDWNEIDMKQALDEAAKTKCFPKIIKEGSDFHTEFLCRHFTRLSPEEMKADANKPEWKRVIAKHLQVLSDSIGKMKCGPFKFQLAPGAKPMRQRPYPLSLIKKDALFKMLKVLMDNDCIEPCKSTDWVSPLLLISKGDGRWRLVIDFRRVNSCIVNETVSYPKPDDIFETVRDAFYMFLIDGRDFYFQRELHPDCRQMTAFMTPWGCYQWKRCPQGLKPSSAAAITPVTQTLQDALHQWALLHCDDLLGWAKTEASSLSRFDWVLTKFGELGVTLGWFKVWILLDKAEYVSHIIEKGKVYPSPKMVDAISRMPEVLHNVKEVQVFVGMMQYFAIYVCAMAQWRSKLTELTKKDVPFVFTQEHVEAVRMLKKLLKGSVVYLVDWGREFHLITDASGLAMAGCLMQKDDDGNYRPLRFMSRSFNKYEKAQENRERELRAGWYCMLKCHSMLDHTVFVWLTDHLNIKYVMNAKVEHGRIARLALWLSNYYFTLQHVAGKMILLQIADALSRLIGSDDPDDGNIFVPFEGKEVRSLLRKAITPILMVCPAGEELSTNTFAEMTRQGVDLVPQPTVNSKLIEIADTWNVQLKQAPSLHELSSQQLRPRRLDAMIVGVTLYSTIPTVEVAMRRSHVNVVAMVECDVDLAESIVERPGDEMQALHFDSARLLTQAILKSQVELPFVTVMHSNLETENPIGVKCTVKERMAERALRTMQMLAALNAMQTVHPVLMVTLQVPDSQKEWAHACVEGTAQRLGYGASMISVLASDHGDFTSKTVSQIVLRRRCIAQRVAMPTLPDKVPTSNPSTIFNMGYEGAPIAAFARGRAIQRCYYSQDRSRGQVQFSDRMERDRVLAVISGGNEEALERSSADQCSAECFSILNPMPLRGARRPVVVTNPRSNPRLWKVRCVTDTEVANALSLNELMKCDLQDMTELRLATTLHTVAPLATIASYYAEVVSNIRSLGWSSSKTEGSMRATDVASVIIQGSIDEQEGIIHVKVPLPIPQNQSQTTQTQLHRRFWLEMHKSPPKKGESWIAVMYIGKSNLMQELCALRPYIKIISFDARSHPGTKGDYDTKDWETTLAVWGAPVAIIGMPPSKVKCDSDSVSNHYDLDNTALTTEAIQENSRVAFLVKDIRTAQQLRPDLKWLIVHPYSKKYLAQEAIGDLVLRERCDTVQFADYNRDFSQKPYVCLHNLRDWHPKKSQGSYSKRKHKKLQRKHQDETSVVWPTTLVSELIVAFEKKPVMVSAITKSQTKKMREAARNAAAVALKAVSELTGILQKLKKSDKQSYADGKGKGQHDKRSEDVGISAKVGLTHDIIRKVQARNENIRSWRSIALLQAKVRRAYKSVPTDLETINGSEGEYYKAFKAIPRQIQGYVEHMFIDEADILVIANANRQDPIPVIDRQLGELMIVVAHDSITGMHMGSDKLRSWLIERCWWYGMWVDVKEHCKFCLMCQRMKFSASPGYGNMQMRWYNGPGKVVCIDLVVLTQSHKSSKGTQYIFTILDCFTHWPDAFPLQRAEASDCADCIVKWCANKGVPTEIIADNGSNLNVSKVITELALKLRVDKRRLTNPESPQGNQVERFHRWLGASMRIALYDFELDIDESLIHLLWVWRGTTCRMTGFTPFFMESGRDMRFPHDLFETSTAELSTTEYVKHLSELTTKVWKVATNAQRIAQEDASRYYNSRHGIKRDIRAGDMVLKRHRTTTPTGVPSHLLPRCSGPYQILRINGKGAIIKHSHTGKESRVSLRLIRRCHIRQDDSGYSETGGFQLAVNEFVIVKMDHVSEEDPKWHVAKLIHITPDEDAWTIQWCNSPGVDQPVRMERDYKPAWEDPVGAEGKEIYSNTPQPHWKPWLHVVTLGRILTPSFRLLLGKIPGRIKIAIKEKYKEKYW